MPVAVSLVTGLLGAGKSTVVQALLAHKPPGEKWAIFVNEVGAVGIDGASHNIGYMMDDTTYVDMPLSEGRKCKAGRCCEACSRNVFPTFATAAGSVCRSIAPTESAFQCSKKPRRFAKR